MVELGRRLQRERLHRGLSLSELAQVLNVTKGYLSRLESGKARPAMGMIERLADLFGADVEPLLVLAGYVPSDIKNILYRHPETAPALLKETFSQLEYGNATDQLELFVPQVGSGMAAPVPANYEIFQADCFEWLDQRDDNSIQAIVTDPPYGLKEYSAEEKVKLRGGRGGVWRIPPALDGYARMPVPRFTVLTGDDKQLLREFMTRWADRAFRVLVPGGHVFIAANPLVSHLVYAALESTGLEKRGEIIRLVQTLRGGDRPKNAHQEFQDVTVMPRSCWEPWGLFRKPCEGRVQDNLRKWKTGGLRRISDEQPFCDVIKSAPTGGLEREIAPHPSLKPQAFLRQLVRASLPLGEGVILDPFMGAGSTIAAACAIGYQSIGIEMDAAFFQMAAQAIPRLSTLSVNGNGASQQAGLFEHLD